MMTFAQSYITITTITFFTIFILLLGQQQWFVTHAFMIQPSSPLTTTITSRHPMISNHHHIMILNSSPKKGFGSNNSNTDNDTTATTSNTMKKKSMGAQQREDSSKRYDTIALQGGQEYRIFVRQFGSIDPSSWLPCGLVAVPRNAQVSDAIYSNIKALQSSIVRTYPKLQGMEGEFEYGYNLKIYPDDPIEVAKKTSSTNNNNDGNLLSMGQNWIRTLLSPMDTSSMKTPPSSS